jgi:hypothetical protein
MRLGSQSGRCEHCNIAAAVCFTGEFAFVTVQSHVALEPAKHGQIDRALKVTAATIEI